jgi:hypothetical protein
MHILCNATLHILRTNYFSEKQDVQLYSILKDIYELYEVATFCFYSVLD